MYSLAKDTIGVGLVVVVVVLAMSFALGIMSVVDVRGFADQIMSQDIVSLIQGGF